MMLYLRLILPLVLLAIVMISWSSATKGAEPETLAS